MKTFNDLKFRPHPAGSHYGVQARMFFDNGYGVSVIKTSFSYGGSEGLYELAVLEGDEKKNELTYSTPVTGDVEGSLKPAKVTDLMKQVQELEKR